MIPTFRYSSILFTLSALFSQAYASPFPVTSSSMLTSPTHGIFFSRKGFHVGTEGTAWVLEEDHSLNRGDQDSSWRLSNEKIKTATAQLKVDSLKMDMSLETYAKRWMRDYGQLGLDVLGTRTFSEGGARGIVIDLLQPKKKRQLRQAVFLKNRSVAILTCSDDQKDFNQSLAECNRLIKNFSWNDLNSQKSF